ncbi:uncharacterized protein N0V89_010888 [Didymosphaeria variabile]|uniref:Rab-GAP TBC domain-containing protein n=1 Tax=Didymosphaeria variabile TaxID=1932322 RepID=A0A9W9C5X7_9PLEO|nr:uncharacterized protein N0V89_010888 [Didymosphaeria variabile]KAJ4346955.1 hypothetical protein N0V89_010888 [Didymosphaeria variabile]
MSPEAVRTPDGDATAEASLPAVQEHPQQASQPAAPPLQQQRGWLSSVRRPKTSPAPKAAIKRTLLTEDDARRDSALASSNSTSSTDPGAVNAPSTPTSLRKTPSLPAIVVQDEPAVPSTSSYHRIPSSDGEAALDFQGIDTVIPTGGFDDLTSPTQISFSKRGSMLLGGKRPNRMNKQLGLVAEGAPAAQPETPPQQAEQDKPQEPKHQDLSSPVTPRLTPQARSPSRVSARRRVVSSRVLSTDEMMLSRKVRSMYHHGNESAANWDDVEEEAASLRTSFVDNSSVTDTPANSSSLAAEGSRAESSSIMSSQRESVVIAKEPNESAGGIEDWSELEGGEVDRYGFIVPKKTTSGGSGNGPDEPRIQRVSTALQLVSEEPRRKGLGRSVSKARSARSANIGIPRRRRSQKSSQPAASVMSNRTARSAAQRPLRQAVNRLPHNRDRRLLDEASDMLKLPPGLAEVAEQKEGGRVAEKARAKEIEREEKWRKMAKVVQAGAKSGGMMFEFDVKDPKVISRTWKGVPDRWRATAWYAFLAASAKADKDSPTDEELVTSFYELQNENSADDMQIDVDVPRTINRHIMFRRRYRGG